MIRHKESVEAVFGMMQKAGPLKVQGAMKEFRLSLMVLTGQDQGESRDLWVRWWQDNKKTFEIPKKPPRLPAPLQKQWDYYWGLYHVEGRKKERTDRGDDPEDDDA